MWELDHKECWVPKNWCFRTVVLQKTLESPLDCKEIKPIKPKGTQPWIFIDGLTMKLKFQSLGHLMWRADSSERTLMLGKTEGRRRGWQRMRWLDGITDLMDISLSKLGIGDGQGSLVCCSPWGCKESDMTEQLNWFNVSENWESWFSELYWRRQQNTKADNLLKVI